MQCIPRAISEKLLPARQHKINKMTAKQANLKARVFQVCAETKNVKDKKIHNKQEYMQLKQFKYVSFDFELVYTIQFLTFWHEIQLLY